MLKMFVALLNSSIITVQNVKMKQKKNNKCQLTSRFQLYRVRGSSCYNENVVSGRKEDWKLWVTIECTRKFPCGLNACICRGCGSRVILRTSGIGVVLPLPTESASPSNPTTWKMTVERVRLRLPVSNWYYRCCSSSLLFICSPFTPIIIPAWGTDSIVKWINKHSQVLDICIEEIVENHLPWYGA